MAIIMMLQGHFVHMLLDTSLVNEHSLFFRTWKFCRGITAPTFFTITGYVFFFLLLEKSKKGEARFRIKKGIKRGLELILWGYLLRVNIPNLFNGYISPGQWQWDVLHVIGLSILFIIGLFVVLKWVFIGSAPTLPQRRKALSILRIGLNKRRPKSISNHIEFVNNYETSYTEREKFFPQVGEVRWGRKTHHPNILIATILFISGICLFAFEPAYIKAELAALPVFIANVFTTYHGSTFSILPWFGYVLLGSSLGIITATWRNHDRFYPIFIAVLTVLGYLLTFHSSWFMVRLGQETGWQVFIDVAYNNYLFIRFGNVLWLIAFFVGIRNLFKPEWLQQIGTNTLW
ncbi:MAG: DUF1624 domain-containing protein, partial [Bacteroidetes bacterium]|nr:DUF1624 domain-containing protein [Bacteroidota bacterium]